jgi:hypothetical protein
LVIPLADREKLVFTNALFISAVIIRNKRRHHPDFDKFGTQGWKALDAEGKLGTFGWRKEQRWALDMGLPGADSLTDPGRNCRNTRYVSPKSTSRS